MMSVALREIEERLSALSPQELLVLERRARELREGNPPGRSEALRAMALDPEMQREIREIDAEFTSTLLDGLDQT